MAVESFLVLFSNMYARFLIEIFHNHTHTTTPDPEAFEAPNNTLA